VVLSCSVCVSSSPTPRTHSLLHHPPPITHALFALRHAIRNFTRPPLALARPFLLFYSPRRCLVSFSSTTSFPCCTAREREAHARSPPSTRPSPLCITTRPSATQHSFYSSTTIHVRYPPSGLVRSPPSFTHRPHPSSRFREAVDVHSFSSTTRSPGLDDREFQSSFQPRTTYLIDNQTITFVSITHA
jgi:hypothetical protein